MKSLGETIARRSAMPDLEELEIFRTVLDGLQTGVYLVDRDRKIRFWNGSAEAITGYHLHDVLGHFSRDNVLVGCDDTGCVLCGAECPLTHVINQGKAREAHVFLRHKSGKSDAGVVAGVFRVRVQLGVGLGAGRGCHQACNHRHRQLSIQG